MTPGAALALSSSMTWLVLFAVPWIVVAARPGVSASRRLLAVALVLTVPLVGPLLALLVRRTRGGQVRLEPVPAVVAHRPSPIEIDLLGNQPPVLERLLADDGAERLAALVHLSSRGDDAAIAVLRWTIEHGPDEAVLAAALTLEEIELRAVTRALATIAPAPIARPRGAQVAAAFAA